MQVVRTPRSEKLKSVPRRRLDSTRASLQVHASALADPRTRPLPYLKMNTWKRLLAFFEESGFSEIAFARLDDCSTLQRSRAGCFFELAFWRALRTIRLRYPESNLPRVYQKV